VGILRVEVRSFGARFWAVMTHLFLWRHSRPPG
jgi:hypothetical protein